MRRVSASRRQLVEALRRAREEVRFLVRAGTLGQEFAGVPEHRIAVRPLVDGKVALEHAALGAERFDAGLDVGLPRRRQRRRRRRIGLRLEAVAVDAHAHAAHFDEHVGAGR